jgi:hypothetical protein
MLWFAGNKYAAASTENQINNYNQSRWDEFYSTDRNSIDTLYLGSSHSYCTFDPELVDAELGTAGYQLGMPLQHLDSTYYTLLEALNYQQPKRVVLELYWDMMDKSFNLTQVSYLFQVMKNAKLKQAFINDFPIGEYIKYNTKVLRYQDDYFAFKNNELKEKIEARYSVKLPEAMKQQGTQEYRSKGYTYCDYVYLADELDKTNQFKGMDGEDVELDSDQLSYLNKIVDRCREDNIELIFVTAPIATFSMPYISNYDLIHDKIQALADKYEVNYLDFNYVQRDEKIFVDTDFRDDAHLNHNGVTKADEYFCKWIRGLGL